MKLWHDDVRPPPEGWTWARTNDIAKHWLQYGGVTEISMDHDLGLDAVDVPDPEEDYEAYLDAICTMGQGEETGYDLVCWMIEHDLVPPKITIHSWNPLGAQKMARHFNDHGHNCRVSPFKVTR